MRKILFLFAALFACVPHAQAQITINLPGVQNTAFPTNTVSAGPLSVVTGQQIWMVCSSVGVTQGNIWTFSDDHSGSWSIVQHGNSATSGIYLAVSTATATANYNFTCAYPGSATRIDIQAWTTTNASTVLDISVCAVNLVCPSQNAPNATTVQPGSITNTNANEIFYSIVYNTTAIGTYTIDSGYTIISTQNTQSVAYKIVSSIAATNPTWTSNGTGVVSWDAFSVGLGQATPVGVPRKHGFVGAKLKRHPKLLYIKEDEEIVTI